MATLDTVGPNTQVPAPTTGLPNLFRDTASFIVILGLAWYSILALVVSQFYSPLGVSPDDVGITYALILAHSVPVAFSMAINTILLGFLFLALSALVARVYSPLRDKLPGKRGVLRLAVITASIVTLINSLLLFQAAAFASDSVRNGTAIVAIYQSPVMGADVYRRFNFIAVPIRAPRVLSIRPTGDSKDASLTANLERGHLMLLGQAHGSYVLYNYSAKTAIYLPTGSFMITTDNEPAVVSY